MMNTEQKTKWPSLMAYINSDLFTFNNITSSIRLRVNNDDDTIDEWEAVVSLLPLKFYRIISSIDGIYTIEKFDSKYARNPKLYAYEKYGTTNMWRAVMILNKCPTIQDFNFKFIKTYNIDKFTQILSVLISRIQHDE